MLSIVGVAASAMPKDAPKDVKFILGLYYGNGEHILLRENTGRLELLYKTEAADNSFAAANIFPLRKLRFDSYTLNESGPMNSAESSVKFERDGDGYGISCRVGGHVYTRAFLGRTLGERAEVFRLPTVSEEEWKKLSREAQQSEMPAVFSAGEKAVLVDVSAVQGIMIDSKYAAEENCFGRALYKNDKLYVARDAAEALGRVQKQLEYYGLGLVLWDAYRPWHISKLAYTALPKDKKFLLPDPDKESNCHNTGNAVDVSLYDLSSGEHLEMISGFDEPSLRQYSDYAGGTARQRYLRDLLRTVMENNGFKGIEMEWWHFEYADGKKWSSLNELYRE